MKRLIAGILLVVLLAGTVACSQSAESLGPAPAPMPAPTPAPTTMIPPAPAPPPEGIFGGIFDGKESPPPITVTSPRPVPAPAPSPAPAQGGSEQSADIDRMIVRTGDMELVVADVAVAVEKISGFAKSFDGYVVSSNIRREGDRLVGTISIRVAAEHFDGVIGALRQLAVEVNSERTTSRDVTEEYVDLSARLDNLEATRIQLEKLLEKTEEKVTDILEVQRELSRVTGEIEQTKGRMQYLEQTSAMSLINIYLTQAELDVTFTVNNRAVKVGQDVRFNPGIGGGVSPYSYEWDFGDGNTSTDLAPTHAYKSEGIYTVTLMVTDDLGSTATRERAGYITVLPGWSAGNTASSAWNGFLTFGRVVVDVLIWAVYFIPLWVVIGVILYFAWWRRRKKS